MRQLGIRTASRHLTVEEVRALGDTPIVLAESPGPGLALVVLDVVLTKSAGALPGGLAFGSNGSGNYLVGYTQGDLSDEAVTAYLAGYGIARVGRAADEGDQNFAAIEDRAATVSSSEDLSAAGCSLDILASLMEVPIPVE